MTTKESAATNELLGLLEARYAMRVLWALRDGRPQTFRLLQDSVGSITPNTLNTRLKELRSARLVGHDGEGYCLTHGGMDLLEQLASLPMFALRWTAQKKKAAAKEPA